MPSFATYWPLAFLMTVLMAVGCKSSQSTTTRGTSEVPSDFQLFITRTGCFGQCPVYELSVNAEGLVRYQGHLNVPNVGRYQKQLSQEQVQSLVLTLKEADFFALDAEYDEGVTDLPTVITEAVLDGQRHKLVNRTGPKSIDQLQDRLDAIIGPEGYEPASKE
jgi:hypothetical protein